MFWTIVGAILFVVWGVPLILWVGAAIIGLVASVISELRGK